MKIFVTGANGFIGRAFCQEALARGHELLCLHHGESGKAASLAIAEGDLASIPWHAVERFGPDTLLHLAWIATPGKYLDSPENKVLEQLSRTLITGLVERGVTHHAAVGTCIEYAPSKSPLNELSSPTKPEFAYSIAKDQLHAWLAARDWEGESSWSWFRVFYPYGPFEHPGRLTTSIIRSLAAREPVSLRTPGSIKDFIFITDLVGAICDALESRLTGPVNLGTGTGTSIRELAEKLAAALGVPTTLVRDAEELSQDPRPVIVADTTRIRSTGWKPRIPLEEGLARLIDSLGPGTA